MKKLIVAIIVLTHFIGVSQDSKASLWKSLQYSGGSSATTMTFPIGSGVLEDTRIPSPDTLSAYLLITTRHMGIAYQKRGFIVMEYGKDAIFLDCNKNVIKQPINVWDFRIVKQPK